MTFITNCRHCQVHFSIVFPGTGRDRIEPGRQNPENVDKLLPIGLSIRELTQKVNDLAPPDPILELLLVILRQQLVQFL